MATSEPWNSWPAKLAHYNNECSRAVTALGEKHVVEG